MKLPHQIICFVTAMLFFSSAFAQKKDSIYTGYTEGIVKDSVDNHVLQVATVSVYKVTDTSLVSYQLTNNSGEFHFRALPVAMPLEIVVSHIGYKYFRQKFIIPAGTGKINLKVLDIAPGYVELSEVTVSDRRPPVQMNGDTLEFNAEAFALDRNAVVEDLLRKLPGVTVWGDGTITVNGKTVQKVLVDGKPFFGGDARIATQNLPKDAIDKIQVYSEKDMQKNPLDSILNVNIKLKKNKKTGFFGKAGAGKGTDERYAADGMISTFTPRTQISLVAATNNINTTANDVSTLMRNSSFKGVGVNVEYQPDFSIEGLHKSTSGGFNFQYDFIPDAGYQKNNRLDANCFITNHNSEVYRNTQTTINLNDTSNLVQKSNSAATTAYTNQHFNTNYNLKNKTIEFYASQSLGLNKRHSYSQETNTAETGLQGLQSTGSTVYDQNNDNQNFLFKTGLRNGPKFYKIDYTFSINNTEDKQINQTIFSSVLNPAQNSKFDRNYNNHLQNLSNALEFKYDNLQRHIFRKKEFYKIQIEFLNSIKINNDNANNVVNDLDTTIQKYIANTYLTNISRYSTVDEMPGLKFERNFSKALSNRYDKTVSASIEAKEQFYNQKNVSQKSFQNFEYAYNKFLPGAGIMYENLQFGIHKTTYKLDYTTSSGYPTVNQIAPLVDSSNIFYQQRGNIYLKPSYKNELAFAVIYTNFRSKNENYVMFNIKAGSIRNAIADSIIYDNLGRAVDYSVNVNGTKYLNISGNFRKVYKYNANQLQINGYSSIDIMRHPNYVNSVLNQSNTLSNTSSLSLSYTLKDFFALEVKEKLSVFSIEQTGSANNNEFKNSIQSTMLSASFNFPKKITLNSNITYNKNTSSYSPTNKFTIWNASIGYRFLKGNQGEIKFSALDLLHQNTSVINYGDNNSLTTGNVNVLQQYFMVTLAYFPRKFGKNEKKSK